MGSVKWTGLSEMQKRIAEYGRKSKEAVLAIATYLEPILTRAAQEGAPWVDRTGAARGGLHSYSEEIAKDIVRIYLSHSMNYGIYLFRAKSCC